MSVNRYDDFALDIGVNNAYLKMNGAFTGDKTVEGENRGHDHNPLTPGNGGELTTAYIKNVPAGNITAENQQDVNNQLDGFVTLARTKVQTRQVVLSGHTSNRISDFLAIGTDLSVNILAATKPLRIAFADGFDDDFGAVDYVKTISQDIVGWSNLPANKTLYLYIGIDANGELEYGYTEILPVYDTDYPSAVADQYYFDTYDYIMYRYSGTDWEQKLRVFVGECVTGASSVTSVVCYAIQGKSMIDSAALASDQLQTIPHYIGRTPTKKDVSLVCISDDQGWAVNDEIILNPNYLIGGAIRRFTVGVDSKNITTIIEAGGIVSHNKTTKAAADLTLSKWKFRIRCEA